MTLLEDNTSNISVDAPVSELTSHLGRSSFELNEALSREGPASVPAGLNDIVGRSWSLQTNLAPSQPSSRPLSQPARQPSYPGSAPGTPARDTGLERTSPRTPPQTWRSQTSAGSPPWVPDGSNAGPPPDRRLREFAANGDLTAVVGRLKGGGEERVNVPDPAWHYGTALHAAVLGGHVHVVRYSSTRASRGR
eukprot:1188439-Prorocentrum_minimum.AAC.1